MPRASDRYQRESSFAFSLAGWLVFAARRRRQTNSAGSAQSSPKTVAATVCYHYCCCCCCCATSGGQLLLIILDRRAKRYARTDSSSALAAPASAAAAATAAAAIAAEPSICPLVRRPIKMGDRLIYWTARTNWLLKSRTLVAACGGLFSSGSKTVKHNNSGGKSKTAGVNKADVSSRL